MNNDVTYHVPLKAVAYEFVVSGSRFIANLYPAASVEEAKAIIAQVRQQHPDATHHVPCYLIGGGNSQVLHCSDDGEPSGTAGKPVLAVMQGSGLGDVVVVVTRYFGGIKLGTGGLVRAYGDAARGVLALVEKGRRVKTRSFEIEVAYGAFNAINRLVENYQGIYLDKQFTDVVSLQIQLQHHWADDFQRELVNLCQGKCQCLELDESVDIIMPIEVN